MIRYKIDFKYVGNNSEPYLWLNDARDFANDYMLLYNFLLIIYFTGSDYTIDKKYITKDYKCL